MAPSLWLLYLFLCKSESLADKLLTSVSSDRIWRTGNRPGWRGRRTSGWGPAWLRGNSRRPAPTTRRFAGPWSRWWFGCRTQPTRETWNFAVRCNFTSDTYCLRWEYNRIPDTRIPKTFEYQTFTSLVRNKTNSCPKCWAALLLSVWQTMETTFYQFDTGLVQNLDPLYTVSNHPKN